MNSPTDFWPKILKPWRKCSRMKQKNENLKCSIISIKDWRKKRKWKTSIEPKMQCPSSVVSVVNLSWEIQLSVLVLICEKTTNGSLRSLYSPWLKMPPVTLLLSNQSLCVGHSAVASMSMFKTLTVMIKKNHKKFKILEDFKLRLREIIRLISLGGRGQGMILLIIRI